MTSSSTYRFFGISLIAFCFAFMSQKQVFAQSVPQRFSYQAVIRDDANQLLNSQSVGIRLSILQGSATGTAAYVETHTASTSTNGLVSLQVGGGTVVSGTLSQIDWASGLYFIKTETDPLGGTNYTITGTSQMLSVPYALFSANGTPGPQGSAGATGPQGPAGQTGATGTAGINGKNALIRTTPETAGANCANGGVKIETGLDADGNGQLSDTEVNVSQTEFICNGSGGSGTGLPSNPPYGTATLYNCDGQFQYTPCLPKVVTNPVTQIYSRAASFSGSVSNDGGSAVSSLGFCWGTSPNPTINDSIALLSNLEQSLFSGGDGRLQPGTTYYVRAFATNGAGNGYGEQKSFTTTQPSTNPSMDVDGNSYNTVTIGAQVWMKENLKVSKYRNGDPIPTNLADTDWQNTTSGAYAIYYNDAANNAAYGKLYNWYTVADNRGLCPIGWHVPSDAEWTALENFLGGSSVAGGKMKSTGTIQAGTGLWQDPNTDASNSSGFTCLPGGLRNNSGTYSSIGGNGGWWSSTEYSTADAWFRLLYYNYGNSYRIKFSKQDGFSVRCLRD